jgi:uncharacterized protein with HEPN domain
LEARYRLSSYDASYLEDIRSYGTRALVLAQGESVETLLGNDAPRFAILHCLMVIGEAARAVSETTTAALPDVPWSKMIGLRNLIAHQYRKVDVAEVLMIVRRDLPPVIERIVTHLEGMT